jgi:radical SAM family protein/uncharacterized protein DUF4070
MGTSLYLINPRSDFPSYSGGEVFESCHLGATITIADLALPTVAALMPADFDVSVCDENVTSIDYDRKSTYVGITGKSSQAQRMAAVADAFRKRGATVIIGGSYASLSPDAVREHCDILVRGEIESIATTLSDDLRRGSWKCEYVGDRPDISANPVPRWDLYPNDSALVGTVQTSRGCPFECDFCDVIQYLGRKQRHKTITQVLRELEAVYRVGYRRVFLADDNFTVYRSRTKELLAAIRDWNDRDAEHEMRFNTQVSIDAAKDEELLQMCHDAGLRAVFIGIETPNVESLRASKKRQNLNVDLVQQVASFVRYGISVTGGMIVGFDSDGLDIFERQLEFAMSSPIPVFTVGALVAPESTPLYERLRGEGRVALDGTEIAGIPWNTNIAPQQMTRDQLMSGLRWLCNKLYEPSAFAERVFRFIDILESGPAAGGTAIREQWRPVNYRVMSLLSRLPTLGAAEAKMFDRITARLVRTPAARPYVSFMLMQYMQIRYMYERGAVWERWISPLRDNRAPAQPLIPVSGVLRQ